MRISLTSPRRIARLALSVLKMRSVYLLTGMLQEFVAAIAQRLQSIQDALKDILPGVTEPGKWRIICDLYENVFIILLYRLDSSEGDPRCCKRTREVAHGGP